jgi:hypothetical protein
LPSTAVALFEKVFGKSEESARQRTQFVIRDLSSADGI